MCKYKQKKFLSLFRIHFLKNLTTSEGNMYTLTYTSKFQMK